MYSSVLWTVSLPSILSEKQAISSPSQLFLCPNPLIVVCCKPDQHVLYGGPADLCHQVLLPRHVRVFPIWLLPVLAVSALKLQLHRTLPAAHILASQSWSWPLRLWLCTFSMPLLQWAPQYWCWFFLSPDHTELSLLTFRTLWNQRILSL